MHPNLPLQFQCNSLPRSRACNSIAIALATLSLTACVADGPPTSTRRDPTPVRQPANLPADRAVLTVGQFADDTDSNGYYDTLLVTVHLFNTQHPLPVAPEGTLTFELSTLDGDNIATWTFDPQKTANARRVSAVGVGHMVHLSLLDVRATDHLEVNAAQLHCRFDPADGKPVSTRPRTVALGPAF